jgi:phosphoribosylglycinamide formyltransferase-1
VDEGIDSGPVIAQRAIELADATDAGAVRDTLRPIEHELLPEVVRLIAAGAVALDPDQPRRVLVRPLYGAAG